MALVLTMAVGACSTPPAHHPPGVPWDPYETRNRDVHEFNKDVDRYAFRPIAKGYSAAVPDDIETFVGRFSDTLSLPGSIVNSLLQLDMRGAGADTARFVINATFGLGGVFDAATEMGLPPARDTDFGETLHVWDVNEGAYVALPFFGPSTERDTAGLVVDFFTNPLDTILSENERYAKAATNISDGLSARGGRLASTVDTVLYESTDSYVQSRSIYLQNRAFELGGGLGETYSDTYVDPYGPVDQ